MTITNNPKRILSYNDALMITQKEYTILKQLGQIERDKIEKENNFEIDSNELNQKLIELITNTSIYPSLSSIKKEVILANSILPDDIKIRDILSEYGFTIYHLKAIIRFRGIIKNYLISKTEINKELKEKIKIYKKVTTKLIYIFDKHFNFNNSTIILNRISEMLVTCPDLFEEKIKTNKLVKQPK